MQNKNTPIEDLRESALNDYSDAAIKAGNFNNFITKAIRAYNPKPERDEWYKILFRLIILPIWCISPFLFFIKLWLKHCFHFVRAGGLSVVYVASQEKESLYDVWSLIKDSGIIKEHVDNQKREFERKDFF